MDRGAWWVTVHGVARVRHDLGTKPTTTTTLQEEKKKKKKEREIIKMQYKNQNFWVWAETVSRRLVF